MSGIKNLTAAKKKMKSSKPYVIIQFLVFSINEHQIDSIKVLAKAKGADSVQLKSAQIYDFTKDHNLIPQNGKYARYKKNSYGNWVIKKKITNKCYKMWHSSVITWDNNIVPCCFDKNSDFKTGNLLENTFAEIWKSPAYNDFRKSILKNRKSIKICCNCTA